MSKGHPRLPGESEENKRIIPYTDVNNNASTISYMRTGWGMNVRCVSTEWLQQTAEFQTHSDAVTTLPCKAIVADFDAINYIILYYIYMQVL